ncbi:MAG: GTP pyrophosphokinase family protein [Clostridiaceae bacterium]|nr:GTP pyrophosphokinase family protein [Clostridiaceae bacterium]
MNKAITIPLVEESPLQISPDMMKTFIWEMQIYKAAIKEMQTKLENLDDSFHARYEYNPIHHIETRLKDTPSIMNKLSKMGHDFSVDAMTTYLHDIAGVRVICNYLDDMDRVADMLLNQDDVELLQRKEYHKHPKSNGYRSLHLVVSIPVFLADEKRIVPVEVQIRTIAMDLWASLEHQLRYKNMNDTPVPKELSERLYSCAMVLTEIDDEMQAIYNEILKLDN